MTIQGAVGTWVGIYNRVYTEILKFSQIELRRALVIGPCKSGRAQPNLVRGGQVSKVTLFPKVAVGDFFGCVFYY